MRAETRRRGEREKRESLRRSRYAVAGRGPFGEEFVTAGGVPLGEVNLATMESRCMPGLYLAGELLDVDGITGGFNFQAAWTTRQTSGSPTPVQYAWAVCAH